MSLSTLPVYLSAAAPEAPAVQTLEFVGLEVAEDASKREVSGLALPYDEDLDRADWMAGTSKMRFAPNAAVLRDNSQLFYGHDHLTRGLPIGRITGHEQTAEGLRITARISETPKGDEVYTLLRDGVLDRFSVGFYYAKNHIEDVDTADAVLVHDEIDVFEVSVVPDPAFRSAVVDSVLSNNPKEARMPCPKCNKVHPDGVTDCATPTTFATAEDVQTLSQSVDTLSRQILTLGAPGTPDGPPVPVPGATYGEFLQMVVNGDTDAQAFLAYVGGVVGDLGDWVKDSWVGDIIREVNANRIAINFFEQQALPSTGMKVEYGKILEDTTSVGEQAAEGDVLPYGKITFDTDTAPLKTYGGWGEMSFQEIQRSSMAVVDKFFRALLRRYAKVTENAVRARLTAATGAKTIVADLTDSDGWIDFLVDAAVHYDDKGVSDGFGVFLGKTAFKDLAKLRDGDNADAPRMLDRNTGSVSIVGLNGTVYSIPFRLLPGLAATDVRMAHPEAIRTFEAAGAPWRLEDENITNLTKAYSIYGYMAVAEQEPDLIVKPVSA